MTQPNELSTEDQKWLDRIRRQVAADTSYGFCFYDLKFLLGLFDRETERLKRQDADVIASYALELQQAKDENKRLKDDLVKVESGNIRLWKENEQIKAERDKLRQGMDVNTSLGETIIGMQEELVAKDMVLGWYAQEKNYRLGVMITMGTAHPMHEAVMTDKGDRARSVLSTYPPREKGADNEQRD